MVYCIINEISYSSSFNIFAVIAGILLIKGSIKTARVVSWFTGFMLVAFIAVFFVMLFIEPIGLKIVTFKLNPIGMTISILLTIALVIFIFWIHLELEKQPAIEARKTVGLSTDKPKFVYMLGGFLAIGLGIILYLSSYGESGQLVKDKALEVYGDEYKYHVSAMNWFGKSVSAQLYAFNDNEIIHLYVQCTESAKGEPITNNCTLRDPR